MGWFEERAGLDETVAVITGGAGGLGEAIVSDLADNGVRVAVLDIDEHAVEALRGALDERSVDAIVRHGDARDPEVLEALFAAVDERWGRLDILVNVVGGTFRAPFTDTTPKGWDALLRTNLIHVFHACSLAVPRMRAGGRGGSIVNVSTIEAHRAAPGFAVYSAAKAGVEQFARTLAVEVGPGRHPGQQRGARCRPHPEHGQAGGPGLGGILVARGRPHRDPDGPYRRPHRRLRLRGVPRLGPVVVRHRPDPPPRRRHVRVLGVVQLARDGLGQLPAGRPGRRPPERRRRQRMTERPYGSWPSPITADLIVTQSVSIGEAAVGLVDVWWAEARPEEGGRVQIVRHRPGGERVDVLPDGFAARTRVHEYGGGAWCLHQGDLVFANWSDQRLWRLDAGADHPFPLTPEPAHEHGDRYADGRFTADAPVGGVRPRAPPGARRRR